VRCLGTEDRATDFIPPSQEVHEFIIFKGSDIKDLQVIEAVAETKTARDKSPETTLTASSTASAPMKPSEVTKASAAPLKPSFAGPKADAAPAKPEPIRKPVKSTVFSSESKDDQRNS